MSRRRGIWHRMRLMALLAGGALASLVHAACESGLAERMHAQLYPQRQLDRALAACKAWPAYAGRSIVVLPLHPDGTSADPRALDLALLLIQRPDNGNTERDTVIAQLYQRAALREPGDAPLQDLRIDTARYLLAPGQRAFGLRARYRGDALAAPFAGETLRLYLPQGQRLQEVLAETEIERDSGRWDLQCEGRFERLRTLVAVEPVEGRRWAELVLSRTLVPRHAQMQPDGQCVERAGAARHAVLRLRHDGQRYPLPEALRPQP